MTRSAFYRSRTLSVYGFGTALALYHYQILFSDGVLAQEVFSRVTLYTMVACLLTATVLTFFDHFSARIWEIWQSVQDGVIGAVAPTAIVLLIPSLSLQLWAGQFYEENHVLVSLRLITNMAIGAALYLSVVALFGRVTGKLLFLR